MASERKCMDRIRDNNNIGQYYYILETNKDYREI